MNDSSTSSEGEGTVGEGEKRDTTQDDRCESLVVAQAATALKKMFSSQDDDDGTEGGTTNNNDTHALDGGFMSIEKDIHKTRHIYFRLFLKLSTWRRPRQRQQQQSGGGRGCNTGFTFHLSAKCHVSISQVHQNINVRSFFYLQPNGQLLEFSADTINLLP